MREADSLLGKYHQQGIFQEVENGNIDAETFRCELSKICGKVLTYQDVENGWKGFVTDEMCIRDRNADGQGVCGMAERSEGKIRRFGM